MCIRDSLRSVKYLCVARARSGTRLKRLGSLLEYCMLAGVPVLGKPTNAFNTFTLLAPQWCCNRVQWISEPHCRRLMKVHQDVRSPGSQLPHLYSLSSQLHVVHDVTSVNVTRTGFAPTRHRKNSSTYGQMLYLCNEKHLIPQLLCFWKLKRRGSAEQAESTLARLKRDDGCLVLIQILKSGIVSLCQYCLLHFEQA